MQDAVFLEKTLLDKCNCKELLYIATFRHSPLLLPLVALMALVGAFVEAWALNQVHVGRIIGLWIFLAAVALGAVCLLIEIKNKKMLAGFTQNTDLFAFYDSYVCILSDASPDPFTVQYAQITKLLETKKYYLFYFGKNGAAFLKKADIKDPVALAQFFKEKRIGQKA